MKKRKLKIKNIIIMVLIIIILCLLLKPKNYLVDYKINDYNVKEQYNKDTKEYYFQISNDHYYYEYYIQSNYKLNRKLIKNINEVSNDKYYCIIPQIKDLTSVPLCNNGTINVDYNLVDEDIKNSFNISQQKSVESKNVDNITIYNTINKKYLLWNYHNFIYINNDEDKTLSLFDADYYNIKLAKIIGEYLLIPNYDQGYEFNEFIIINLKTLKTKKWKIKYDISVDSYILGSYDKSIYLVDKNNLIEYEIVPSHQKIRIVGTSTKDGTIYQNGFNKISLNKLVQEEYKFIYNNSYHYIIDDNMLFMNTNNSKTLISNKNVKFIVYEGKFEVYYLVDQDLYYYNQELGEVKLMTNFEWNFNFQNMIFPY